MKVVINDMHLLWQVVKLKIVEITTTLDIKICVSDLALTKRSTRQMLDMKNYLEDDSIFVKKFTYTEIKQIQSIAQSHSYSLAPTDCSSILLAKQLPGYLLTDELKIKEAAKQSGVKTKQPEWLFEQMILEGYNFSYTQIEEIKRII